MHATYKIILDGLEKVVSQLDAHIPTNDPFGIAHNNWSFAAITKYELIEDVHLLIKSIEDQAEDEIGGDFEPLLLDYDRRLNHLRSQTIPNMWSNAGQALPAYVLTMQGLRLIVNRSFPQIDNKIDSVKLRKLTTQVRSMEDRLKALSPRTNTLEEMIFRIESAHDAADQLPSDLASLTEARAKLEEVLRDAIKNQGHIEELRIKADDIDKKLVDSHKEAESVLGRCETAYSAATSVGLAAAFTERSKSLSDSMWFWVGCLVVALVVGSFYGSSQLHALSDLFKQPNLSVSVVILNLMLSALSVGAPVWFGWLATKQIGHRFKLAEDYAFKASISRAYEGFRREAARVDKDMEARLLASALDRLDELPLRLIEVETHGSPWQELASSNLIKEAVRVAPEFAGQIKDLAVKVVSASAASKGGAQVAGAKSAEPSQQ